ncbi:MAG: hypothetical protein ACLGIG_03240 [Actinomycetes bacterium]
MRRARLLAALLGTALMTGCGFEGVYSLPLPGAAGSGDDTYQVVVQFEDALDLVPYTQVASLVVESVQLPADAAEYPEVRLLACLDVSGVQAVDANGTSLVSPDRLDRIASRVLLQRFDRGDFAQDPDRSGWFVAEVEQRGQSC